MTLRFSLFEPPQLILRNDRYAWNMDYLNYLGNLLIIPFKMIFFLTIENRYFAFCLFLLKWRFVLHTLSDDTVFFFFPS